MSSHSPASSSQIVTLPAIPELYDANFLDVLLPAQPQYQPLVKSAATNPMMDALKATVHQTFTDNDAAAWNSTLSPTLDLFQALAPHANRDTLAKFLADAWAEDPALTLRIIWGTRSIHDGKGEKELFYQAFGWLYAHHPRTAVHNLRLLVAPVCERKSARTSMAHGYWKDLVNILALATLDQLGPSSAPVWFLHHPRGRKEIEQAGRQGYLEEEPGPKEARAALRHAHLLAKLAEPTFRALYIGVARLFAAQLTADFYLLQKVDAAPADSDEFWRPSKQLTLAGKWAPTPRMAHDRVTNIASAIGLLLHRAGVTAPLKLDVGADTTPDAAALHVLRSFYQRWLLTPLRAALAVPEPLMSARRWTEIQYGRVSSLSMKANTPRFFTHDPAGFEAYLTKVESGQAGISGATLMPHELVSEAWRLAQIPKHRPDPTRPNVKDVEKKIADIQARVVEGQWGTLVERLREAGALDNTIAVCDVSGSMGSPRDTPRKGQPVEPLMPAVSLSLILAQLAAPPFGGGFITFSERPRYVKTDVAQNGLLATVEQMLSQTAGLNTDLHAVFCGLLLPLAVSRKVAPADMIKRVVIFSDMQFDECSPGADPANWETSHDRIVQAYRDAGYEPPQIVYWNLAAQDRSAAGLRAMPVTGATKGVALVNGFSPSLLKVFMGDAEAEEEPDWEMVADEKKATGAEEFNPIAIMKKAVGKQSFQGLAVLD